MIKRGLVLGAIGIALLLLAKFLDLKPDHVICIWCSTKYTDGRPLEDSTGETSEHLALKAAITSKKLGLVEDISRIEQKILEFSGHIAQEKINVQNLQTANATLQDGLSRLRDEYATAMRLMTNPVRRLDADAALATLRQFPFAIIKKGFFNKELVTGAPDVDPGEDPVFSRATNAKGDRLVAFIDPVLIPIVWNDPTYDDAARLVASEGYRHANAYDLVSYASHVGHDGFPPGCIIATATTFPVAGTLYSPIICKDPKQPRLIARGVRWAEQGRGNYGYANIISHVLAIKQ